MEKTENKSAARRGNNRLVIIAAGAVLLVGVIIAIVALISHKTPECGEDEIVKDGQCVAKFETDTYTYEHDYKDKKNKHVKITVKVPKSLGYEYKKDDTRIQLYRDSDRSTISVYTMLTSKNSIVMEETDYSKSAWADYKKTENEDGSEIVEINRIRSNGSIYGVEWSKAFSKVVENYWSGVRVSVVASGLDQGKDSSFGGKDYKTFEARKTFESEEYQYMLKSITVEVTDMPTLDED